VPDNRPRSCSQLASPQTTGDAQRKLANGKLPCTASPPGTPRPWPPRHTDGPCYEAPDSKADSAHRGARRWRRPSFVCLPPEAEEVLERPASRMSLLGDPHMRLCFLVHAVGGRTLSGAAKHHACILDPPMHFPDLGACTSRSCCHALACHRHCDVGAGFSRVHHTISSGRGRT